MAAIVHSQFIAGQIQSNSNKQQFSSIFKQQYDFKHVSIASTELKLSERMFVNYKRKRLNYFLLVESILNEIFKPEPVINKEGFHCKANPFLEIEETKGNTGFIKFGMIINLGLK